jgi:hypothetical protein
MAALGQWESLDGHIQATSADSHTKQANGALLSYSRDRQASDANGQRR